LVKGLRSAGFTVNTPVATFYVWLPVPSPYTSASLTAKLLTEAGVVVTPGNGFGEPGEGYVRLALTQDDSRLMEAADRIRRLEL
jgi:LL-diaminopimelate aminotransferase